MEAGCRTRGSKKTSGGGLPRSSSGFQCTCGFWLDRSFFFWLDQVPVALRERYATR